MHALNVRQLREFPIAEDADEVKRPFRLWDSAAKEQVRWAYFKSLRHAHTRALSEAAWSKGDSVFEIFDCRNGGLRGQYHRQGSQIKFWRSSHSVDTTV